MEGVMKMKRVMGFVTVAMLVLGIVAARAQEEKPDATLRLSGGSVAAGIGFSWASGTLSFQGKEYPISVNGLSVGDVGVTKLEASGSVYGLKSLKDFDGNYTAVAAGATVAGGGGAVTMRNQNGVKVNLVSTTQGVKFVLGASGVSMKIKE